MADKKRTQGKDTAGDSVSDEEKALKPHADNTEWLRDQVGEDHNLSGSSTYRTLPDQPDSQAEQKGKKDAKDRQSNR